jgi:GT2 family glycosyltransferase
MPSSGDHKRDARDGAARLAAIVPATDSPASLERCVRALRAAQPPPDEIVVVTEPPGTAPAAARNAGAGATDAEVLLFVDSDVVVDRGAVGRVREALAADPGLAAVFGSYDDAPAAPGMVSRYRNLLHHHVHTTSPGEASTFWAGLGAVRRRAFERVGGFDAARYPRPEVEDIELGMRLRASGARIRLDPRLRGTHLKRWGLTEMVRTDFARRGVPWARLQLEAGAAASELNLGWRHRLGALASVAAAAALFARRPAAAGLAVAALLAIHLPFFRLLARRGGPLLAAAGVPLHTIHHLAAVAAVPVAGVAHLRSASEADR